MASTVATTSPSTTAPTAVSSTTTVTTTVSTSTDVDYGDEIPLNFMDVTYYFAIAVIVGQLIAAVVGTFGNLLVLVAVGTNRQLRSLESVFIVNLALCDLYITLFAQPLSVLAKVIGWRSFEGVPGVCFFIGSMCTVACVGSCLTLTVMSLNRYVLICHHHLYSKIFTYRNSIGMCLFILFFAILLICLNFTGIGDHSFDYKSYECIWDRMATHDFTIFFSIVLVWMPMTVSGAAYARTYWFVCKVRETVGKSMGGAGGAGGSKAGTKASVSRETSGTLLTERSGGPEGGANGASTVNGKAWEGAAEEDSDDDDDDAVSTNTTILDHDTTTTTTTTTNNNITQDGPSTNGGSAGGGPPAAKDGTGGVARRHLEPPHTRRAAPNPTLPAPVRPAAATTPGRKPPGAGGTGAAAAAAAASAPATHPGMKLFRPLFIIYVAFTTCWLPYSVGVSADRFNAFPPELHAFITAFAHANSSVNWLVYYMTHNKMRRAFLSLLRCRRNQLSSSSVQPIVTHTAKTDAAKTETFA